VKGTASLVLDGGVRFGAGGPRDAAV